MQFNGLYLNDSVVLSKVTIFLQVPTKVYPWHPLDEQLFTSFALPQGVAAPSALKNKPRIAALPNTQHPENKKMFLNSSGFYWILEETQKAAIPKSPYLTVLSTAVLTAQQNSV